MPKLTVFKKVYWKSAGKEISGKVKQIMSDHAVVKAEDGSEYIVRSAVLNTKRPTKNS